ncbi:MAG: cytidylate kinase-like family protein [Lachnospiraceae bacterium]|nr:cytidylate kinase-like family protein [Lachnospiraceae bacterium]
MGKQIIIALSRTCGSGGREIGRELAKRLGIDFLDRELLDSIAEEKGVNPEKLRPFEEKARNLLISRTVRSIHGKHTNSPEEIVSQQQFDYILKKAQAGDSFVLIGRCGTQVLKDYPELVKVFVTGDSEHRIKRIMELFHMLRPEARNLIRKKDRQRKAYHNAYCSKKWGDPSAYDIMFSSSRLGVPGSVDLIMNYLDLRMAEEAKSPEEQKEDLDRREV